MIFMFLQACAWFLKIDPVHIVGIHMYVCVYVCVHVCVHVCVSTPKAINN